MARRLPLARPLPFNYGGRHDVVTPRPASESRGGGRCIACRPGPSHRRTKRDELTRSQINLMTESVAR